MLPSYEIYKMIGRGGMGAVYMGRSLSLDRPVAIKLLSSELEQVDAGFVDRFKNEARSMAKLNHPGIVPIYNFGETENGLLYIVMEYVDGTDVARMIAAKGRLHTDHAVAITAQVCDALTYAHDLGIIHRDIKPANVMVGNDGAVKIADFGLAKADGLDSDSLGLTQSGVAMGTMHYMAPEIMAFGIKDADHRADIFALGVMLYHMLTGKLPHGMFELPSIQVPGMDPRYDDIIARAMREDREERYPSAQALRNALEGIVTQPLARAKLAEKTPKRKAPPAPTANVRSRRTGRRNSRATPTTRVGSPSRRKHETSFFALTFLVLLVAGAGGFWWWMNQGDTPDLPSEDLFSTSTTNSSSVDSSESPAAQKTETTPSETKESETIDESASASVPPPSLEPTESTSAETDTDWLVGKWHQTNGGKPLPIYILELEKDGGARFTSTQKMVTGTWQIQGEKLIFEWINDIRYEMELPNSGGSEELSGKLYQAKGRTLSTRMKKVE